MSEADVTVLTQGIARLLDLNSSQDKLEKYIKQLRVLCFGPPEDKLTRYFGGELSSEECLDCLLSLDSILDHCLSNSQNGLELALCISNLTSLSNTGVVFLSSLLPTLMRNIPVKDVQPVLQALWKHKDKSKMPVPLIECLLLERQELENVLIRSYLQLVDSPDNLSHSIVWDSLRYWAKSSASSPFIFQSITTVLNNLLVHTNNSCVLLKLLNNYIEMVHDICCDNLVSLYPIEYQSVVSILASSPESYKHLSNDDLELFVVKMIKPYLSEPHICLMLMSHFPTWLNMNNNLITPVDLGVA